MILLVLSAMLFAAAVSAAPRYERPPDMPDFSHKLVRFDKPDFSIKLPKGFKSVVDSDNELVDGNAGHKLWLWGRVVREEGRFLDARLRELYLRTRCAAEKGKASSDRRGIRTKYIEGFQVLCGAPRSHFTAIDEFSIGWVKIWANSRKTDSRYTIELQSTEPAHEEYVREVLERIVYSLREPKERWLPKEKRPEKSGPKRRWWPRWRKRNAATEEPIFLH